jgi:hypothetical protein
LPAENNSEEVGRKVAALGVSSLAEQIAMVGGKPESRMLGNSNKTIPYAIMTIQRQAEEVGGCASPSPEAGVFGSCRREGSTDLYFGLFTITIQKC